MKPASDAIADDRRTFHRTVAVLREFGSIVEWVQLVEKGRRERVEPPSSLSLVTPVSRATMKALPVLQITAPFAARGSLTVLAFARQTRHINRMYALLPDLGRYYRSMAGDPVRQFAAEQHIRNVWSRLVDRSRGYWLNGLGFREYAS